MLAFILFLNLLSFFRLFICDENSLLYDTSNIEILIIFFFAKNFMSFHNFHSHFGNFITLVIAHFFNNVVDNDLGKLVNEISHTWIVLQNLHFNGTEGFPCTFWKLLSHFAFLIFKRRPFNWWKPFMFHLLLVFCFAFAEHLLLFHLLFHPQVNLHAFSVRLDILLIVYLNVLDGFMLIFALGFRIPIQSILSLLLCLFFIAFGLGVLRLWRFRRF